MAKEKKIQVPEIRKIDNQKEYPIEFERMQSGTVRVYNKKKDTYSEMSRTFAKKLLSSSPSGSYKIIE